MFKSILFNGMPFSPLFDEDTGAGNGGNGSGTPGASGNSSTPFAVFPDADSFNSRMNREAKKIVSAQIKELGYEKLEDLKSALEGFKGLQTQFDTAKSTFATSEQGYKTSIEAANNRLIQYEVRLQAMNLGIVDPDAAYALMDKSNVKLDDKGTVTGIKEALESLVSEKKYLLGNKGAGSAGTDFSGGNGDKSTLTMEVIKAMSQEEVARRLPEINAFLAKQGK